MGKTTKIQWCDSTLNLLVGCAGCELHPDHCYAAELVGRYSGHKGWPVKFTQPQVYLERLEQALRWQDLTGKTRPDKPWLDRRPRMIFVNDLGDTFSRATSASQLKALGPSFSEMGQSPHRWLLLTKWPARMAEFVYCWCRRFGAQWPDNIWLGISATTQKTLDTRVHDLVYHVRRPGGMPHLFASIEPMLEPIKFSTLANNWFAPGGLEWVIFGGESGRNARPCDINGIMDGLRDCEVNEVPAFIKQLGAVPFDGVFSDAPDGPLATWIRDDMTDPKGGDWTEWPEYLRVREVP